MEREKKTLSAGVVILLVMAFMPLQFVLSPIGLLIILAVLLWIRKPVKKIVLE